MDGKWRNRLRHGLRQDLTVRRAPLPPDPQHWLFHKDAVQQAARGYRGLPPELITAMATAAPTAMHLFTAKQGPRTVAAMLFALHGRGATYLIGWSDPTGRRLSAHNLLLWHGMGELCALGAQQIDLGLCDDRHAPGLTHFKRSSGAQVRALGGTWGEAGPTAPLHAVLRRVAGMRRA
jgi:CelD/BcsL family acetyltransferase involved in cellulose biosynthesis